jgi:hypothetical protein
MHNAHPRFLDPELQNTPRQIAALSTIKFYLQKFAKRLFKTAFKINTWLIHF